LIPAIGLFRIGPIVGQLINLGALVRLMSSNLKIRTVSALHIGGVVSDTVGTMFIMQLLPQTTLYHTGISTSPQAKFCPFYLPLIDM
jgi:hypothetical protein